MLSPAKKCGVVLAGVLSLTLAAAAPIGLASAAPTSEGQSYLDKAEKLQKEGDFAAAIIQLKNAVRVDPDLLPARYELGLLYLRTNDPGAAQRELETARTRGYDENKIVQPLVRAYLAQGRFQDVIKKFDPNAFTGTTQGELLAMQVRAHLALQETPAARGLIDKALEIAPTSPSVLIAAATLARIEQKYPEADKYIERGLASEPDNAELLVLQAESRQQAKDLDGAIKSLDHAIEKQPKYPRARVARAMVNLTRNKLDLVRADVKEVLTIDPKNPLGLYLRAVVLSQEGQYRDAAQVLLALPELLDSYPPARYLLAASAFADNQLQSAFSNAELYLKKMPGDPIGSKLLAAIAMRLNDPKRAVELLEPLAQAEPNDNALKLQLASAYLGAGRSEEAVKLFEQGVKNDPENAQARMALAVSQLQSGATDAGVVQLENLIKAKPDSLQANQLLILSHMQSKKYDKALEVADAMIKANPKNAEAYSLKGTVQLATNDVEGARKSFKAALDKDPKFAAAMLNLARVEEKAKDPKAAADWYRKTIAVDPKNLTAYYGAANLSLVDGKMDGAVTLLEQAIAANTTNPDPRLRLIELLLRAEQTGRALIAARDLSNLLPDDPRSVDALGRAQLAHGDTVTGLASYRRLVTLTPKNPESKRRLARALIGAANPSKPEAAPVAAAAKASLYAEAKTALDGALADAPDYREAITDRVTLEKEMSGDAAALKLALALVAERPDSISRRVIAGDFASTISRNDVAMAQYKAAWEKSKNGVLLQRLYTTMARDKKGAEGLQMLKTWAAQNPTDYDTRFLIASIYINDGHFDDAIKETESMGGALPENPVLLNNLAWLYGERNDPKAFKMGEKALELAPDSPDVLDTLGWLEVQKRDLKTGTALLAKSYERAGTSPVIGYHYAVALKRSGDKAKAATVIKKVLENKAPFKERAAAEALLKEMGG